MAYDIEVLSRAVAAAAIGALVAAIGLRLLTRRRGWRQGAAFFRNKVVWVTGASSGIGEELVYAFHRCGARLIISARRTEELARVRAECDRRMQQDAHEGDERDALPPRIVQLDLANTNALASKASEALGCYGHIDVVVHCGGISSRGFAVDTMLSVDTELMAVNFFGPVAITKALLPSMIARRSGHVVAISSVQGLVGIPSRAAYAASKHALHGFFNSLRAELSPANVDVTVVCPGYVRTSLSLNARSANGSPHGVMDDATARGMLPEQLAAHILIAVQRREAEIVVADGSARAAVWLQRWFPRLLRALLARRAAKELVSHAHQS